MGHASHGGKLGVGVEQVQHRVAFGGCPPARRPGRHVDVKGAGFVQDGGPEAVRAAKDRLRPRLRMAAEAYKNCGKEKKVFHIIIR